MQSTRKNAMRLMVLMGGTVALAAVSAAAGCTDGHSHAADTKPHGEAPAAAQAVTNRIDLPEAARKNLGITFATAEMRRVTATLRLPGVVESSPGALKEMRAPVAGRVEITAVGGQTVAAGAELFRVFAPELSDMRRSLHEARAAVDQAAAATTLAGAKLAQVRRAAEIAASRIASVEAQRPVHDALKTALKDEVRVRETRVAELEALRDSGAGKAAELSESRAALAGSKSALAAAEVERAKLDAEVAEATAEKERALAEIPVLVAEDAAAATALRTATGASELGRAAALARLAAWGVKPNDLSSSPDAAPAIPDSIAVRAPVAGVVVELHAVSGAVVEAGTEVLELLDGASIRVRASVSGSAAASLRDGMAATLHPAAGSTTAAVPSLATTAPTFDPAARMTEFLVTPAAAATWLRPGMAVTVEFVTDGTAAPELAIPAAAIIQDGLQHIYFRRDPADPNKVIREVADMGASDGTWVVLRSGVAAGDQVVLDGIYEMKLSGQGSAAGKAGHFHADGTFHEGKD
jgi:multidrug resistance efflux pump